MHHKMKEIQNYLKIPNYEEFAKILNTNKARITYLFGKVSTRPKKLKNEEIEILVNEYSINKKWLIGEDKNMIDFEKKQENELLGIFKKLSRERQVYYLVLMKSELNLI